MMNADAYQTRRHVFTKLPLSEHHEDHRMNPSTFIAACAMILKNTISSKPMVEWDLGYPAKGIILAYLTQR